MQATFILEPNEINASLIEKLKVMFGDKKIELNVQEADDTAHLSASTANKERLDAAIANIQSGKNLVEADAKLFQ
jgi:cell division protein FtsB